MFGLTGPLGKGLGLLPTSKGVHIAFSAGTGILPFVDMVAKLLLQEMNSLPDEDEKFHDDFKLVMFIGFQNRKDGIALPIVDGLKELVNKSNKSKRFRVFFRFGDAKPKQPRWDEAFIKEVLETYQPEGINKIWVCGPPLLEEQFDMALSKIAPTFGLNFAT